MKKSILFTSIVGLLMFSCQTQPTVSVPWADCSQQYNIDNSINVFSCETDGGFSIKAGRSYWIRMSTGFEGENGEQEARDHLPNFEMTVTINDVSLPMDGTLIVEYNDGAGFWEINSYHCTGDLDVGEYELIGTGYSHGELVGWSPSCILTVK